MIRIAMLSPIAWRTPPRHYGPWEWVVSQLTENLVARGLDVTLFATGDSQTAGKLQWVCPRPYEEDKSLDPKVWESLHISNVFEQADKFDIIHNHFDFLPLTYSSLVKTPILTTIHGFSSSKLLPVYKKYNKSIHYVSISDADRNRELDYIATIHHGIPIEDYSFSPNTGKYLLVFGRIHHDKGVHKAIQLAQKVNLPLVIAGIIQDKKYFQDKVEPFVDGKKISYIGSVGPDTKSKILSNALALLHLINFDEPFGLSVIEAMACGTPVIAMNRGAMPEIIKDGKNGFLVNSLQEAEQKIEMLQQINRAFCRNYVQQKFTVRCMVDKYIKVYEKIMAG